MRDYQFKGGEGQSKSLLWVMTFFLPWNQISRKFASFPTGVPTMAGAHPPPPPSLPTQPGPLQDLRRHGSQQSEEDGSSRGRLSADRLAGGLGELARSLLSIGLTAMMDCRPGSKVSTRRSRSHSSRGSDKSQGWRRAFSFR